MLLNGFHHHISCAWLAWPSFGTAVPGNHSSRNPWSLLFGRRQAKLGSSCFLLIKYNCFRSRCHCHLPSASGSTNGGGSGSVHSFLCLIHIYEHRLLPETPLCFRRQSCGVSRLTVFKNRRVICRCRPAKVQGDTQTANSQSGHC